MRIVHNNIIKRLTAVLICLVMLAGDLNISALALSTNGAVDSAAADTLSLDTPETPEDPETPETPEDPETPEIPEDPEDPDTPDTPETPEPSEEDENTETPEVLSEDEPIIEESAFDKMYSQVFGSAYDGTAAVVYVAGDCPTQSSQVKGSSLNPYTSLAEAYNNLPYEGGIIVLESEYEFDGTIYAGYTAGGDTALVNSGWPTVSKPAIVTAQNQTTALGIGKDWTFYENIGFYNVSLAVIGAGAYQIYANGKTAVFGGEGSNNLSVRLDSGAVYYPTLFGGTNSGTVDGTNLIVNGGTWDRIFGGGEPGTTVIGAAKTTVNGRIDNPDGTVQQGSSVKLINKRSAEYKTGSHVCGGAATRVGNEITGTVGSVDLTISNLNTLTNYTGAGIAMNSGEVAGDVSVTVKDSILYLIRRGDGSIGGGLQLDMTGVSINTVSFKGFNNTDFGFTTNGANLTVNCTGCTIGTLESRALNAAGAQGDRGINLIYRYTFDNCTVNEQLNCAPQYAAGFECNLKDITFGNKARVVMTSDVKATLTNLKRLYVRDPNVVSAGNAANNPEGSCSFIISPSASTKLTLNNTTLDTTTHDTSKKLTFGRITLENGSLIGNNILVNEFGGVGELYLTDNSTLTIREKLAEDTNILFGSSGELTGLCCVASSDPSRQNGGEIRYAEGYPYTETILNNSSTYWYISAKEITFNPAEIIYVDQTYAEEYRDGTSSSPYNSLEEAYENITSERKHIVLMAQYDMQPNAGFPKTQLPDGVDFVTISANDGLNDYTEIAVLNFVGGTYCDLYSNTIFENIRLVNSNEVVNDKQTYITLYMGGNAVQVLENVTLTGNFNLYAGGLTNERKTVDKVSMVVHSGRWKNVGYDYTIAAVGNSENLDSETNTCSDDVVSIDVDGITSGTLVLRGGTVYGNTKVRGTNRGGQTNTILTGTFQGDVDLYEENIENTYGETVSGTYHGKMTWTSKGTQAGYYGASISGKYYGGLEIRLSEISNLASGSNNSFALGSLTVENEPADLYIPEGSRNYKIRIGSDAVFALSQPFNVHLDENISYMGWVSDEGISREITEDRSKPIVPNLNLIIDGKERETPKSFVLRAFYGFDKVTVMGNAAINAYTDLDVNSFELGEGVTVNAFKTTTVRNDATMADGSRLSSNGALKIGTLSAAEDGDTPVLELKAPIGTENEVSGEVSGSFMLLTNQPYTDVNSCEVLNITEAYRNNFAQANEDIYFANAEDGVPYGKICFGSMIDYSRVYVNSAVGSNANDGTTADKAVQTLEKAYELVTDNGEIIICDNYTVASWPENATKRVTVTSYDGTTDFRTLNNAALTVSAARIDLLADTAFGLLKIAPTINDVNLCASGYKFTLGLSPEEMAEIPSGIDNLTTTRAVNVHGNGYRGSLKTELHIHSGTYNGIYAINGVDNRYPGEPSTEGYVYNVTMTGGTANLLTTGSTYIYGGRGNTKFTLSGGYVKTVYANRTDSSPKRMEYFDISEAFKCDTFYFGSSTGSVSQKLEVYIHDLDDGNTFDKFILTNSANNVAVDAPVDLYIENAHVGVVSGGKNNSADYHNKSGDITIHLRENAIVDEIYAGGTGNFETINRMFVRIEDPSARIGTLKRTGTLGANGAAHLEAVVDTGSQNQEAYKVDFLEGKVDVLNVESGYVSVSRDKSASIHDLSVSKDGKLYIENGSIFSGSYSGSEDQDSPAVMRLDNAANITFEGSVSGYTKLEPVTNFQNGLIIKTNVYGEDDIANAFSYESDGEEQISYSNGVWTIEDKEAGSVRGTVYADGKNGVDGAEGTHAAPLRDLASAYEKAAEIYAALKNMTEEAIEALTDEEAARRSVILETGLSIVVRNDISIGIMSDLDTDMPQVAITAEEGGAILFEDNAQYIYSVPIATTIKSIALKSRCTTQTPIIYAQGNKLYVGEGVTTSTVADKDFVVYGGGESAVENVDLTVMSGKWGAIYGGSPSSSVSGDVLLTVGGNTNASQVFGGGQYASANVEGNIKLTICGGKYTNVYGSGYNASAGTVTTDFSYGEVQNLYGAGYEQTSVTKNTVVTIGSDSGEKASITGMFRGSGQRGELSEKVTVTVKNTADIRSEVQFCAGGYSGTVPTAELNIIGGEFGCDVFAGGWGEKKQGDYGTTTSTALTISGGTVKGNIYGGGNLGCVGTSETRGNTNVMLFGGRIIGNVYGGGKNASTYGDINLEVNITDAVHSSFSGSIFGGAEGYSEKADVDGTVTVKVESANITANQPNDTEFYAIYGGGDVYGTVKKTVVDVNVNPVCRVFGGGRGTDTTVEESKVTLNNKAVMSADEETYHVYGGGNLGYTKASDVTVVNWTGDVFGGGRGEVEQADQVMNTLRSVAKHAYAQYIAPIMAARIEGLKDAKTEKSKVTIQGKLTGNVYGGGEFATTGEEKADENEYSEAVTEVIIASGADIDGGVYGGGKGMEITVSGDDDASKAYAVIYGSTHVSAEGGNSNGAVFGGGKNAPVMGNTNVDVSGGTLHEVFGGNDASGAIEGATIVKVSGGKVCNVSTAPNGELVPGGVYGGGRLASYNGSKVGDLAGIADGTNVIISGGEVSEAYAAGQGLTAVVTNANLTVTGGTVTTAYGGGDAATVSKTTTVTINHDKDTKCVETLFAGNNHAVMLIQPAVNLLSGHIGTFYGGGNNGDMKVGGGLVYGSGVGSGKDAFSSADITIGTVFGGCKSAAVTEGVSLTLTAGRYNTVYGGNDVSGYMPSTYVELAGATVGYTDNSAGGLYGGGNEADTVSTTVVLNSGTATNVYGGGNKATVTESVTVKTGEKSVSDGEVSSTGVAQVTNLFCGNNNADMNIQPTIDLRSGKVDTFYGGGDNGKMTHAGGIEYIFDRPEMEYGVIIGGCNQADVTDSVTLIINNARVNTAVYAGCDTKGHVPTATVEITGDLRTFVGDGVTAVYGGGRGLLTEVDTSYVRVLNGKLEGNVYGGSGYGSVANANVTVHEGEDIANPRIEIIGSVYGAGYGVTSHTTNTNVTVDMALVIDTNEVTHENGNYDLFVNEHAVMINEQEDLSGQTAVELRWNTGRENAVSVIRGHVYGGGDMGQVGKGTINSSKNTAEIITEGKTQVLVKGGYIIGDVFGGGNGTPAAGTSYSPDMGAVFGHCGVDVTGGYVDGSLFGGGLQSRVYAGEDNSATTVNIWETREGKEYANSEIIHTPPAKGINAATTPVVLGGSVFGGGKKGEGIQTNPTVYTVVGNTAVSIIGVHDPDDVSVKRTPTAIYFDGSHEGGVYGDGNLCLVNGKRTVNIRCFHCGYGDGAGGYINHLKVFYSLQRADEVNVSHSKFVLLGAKDLVDENAGDTLYSINRVGQLNMYTNSRIKLTTIVNYLGGLWSDEQSDTRYINRGNNGENNYITRSGVVCDNPSDPNNGKYNNPDGSIRIVVGNHDRVKYFREQYNNYLNGSTTDTSSETANFATLKSFNEICVANGKYLEIKKSDTEYGDVKGMFMLSLLRANPGEGGGFVYAGIGDSGEENLNSGSTGAFVCVTKDSNAAAGDEQYMIIYHDVGGYRGDGTTGDYTYYYWYIKGDKYNYDIDIDGYIGTAETSFDNSVALADIEADRSYYHYVLKDIIGEAPSETSDGKHFNKSRLKDSWNEEEDKALDVYALELQMVRNGQPVSLGFLGCDDNDKWYLKTADGTVKHGMSAGTDEKDKRDNDVYSVIEGTRSLEFQVVLHRGSLVQTEIRNVKLALDFVAYPYKSDGYSDKDTSAIQVRINTSITRIVPTQDVYIGSGRLYAGVHGSSEPNITKESAFTVQYVTKFTPGSFSNAQAKMTESLTTKCEETYLMDEETGVGFTLDKDGKLIYTTKGAIADYTITHSAEGYTVSYTDSNGGAITHDLKLSRTEMSNAEIPAGTMITMIAQIDSYAPTFWYYYCKTATDTVSLGDFVKMNAAFNSSDKFDFDKASGGKVTHTSVQRITENLIFIFDFSKAKVEEDLIGKLRLLHTFKHDAQDVDIMDNVSVKTTENATETVTVYNRSYPVISNEFKVSHEENGIEMFTIEPISDGNFGDSYELKFAIQENSVVTDTRYREREYSILLEQIGDDGNPIQFPEGTTFTYGGKELSAGADNKSVSIPVKNSGVHAVTMQTPLEGFNQGEVTLKATLYSSAVVGYYNELSTGESREQSFTVDTPPIFALSVSQENGNHLFSRNGENNALDLTIETRSEIEGDTESVMLQLFKYDRFKKVYKTVDLNDVFDNAYLSVTDDGGLSFPANVKSNAERGTYRLEFRYHNKTEYWDFIVK